MRIFEIERSTDDLDVLVDRVAELERKVVALEAQIALLGNPVPIHRYGVGTGLPSASGTRWNQ
jgi:hypothetical protein